MKDIQNVDQQTRIHHINHYLPIAMVIAKVESYNDDLHKLIQAYRSTYRDSKNLDQNYILEDGQFILQALKAILKNDEDDCFRLLLLNMKSTVPILSHPFIDIVDKMNRYEMLKDYFKYLHDEIISKGHLTRDKLYSISQTLDTHDLTACVNNHVLTKDRLLHLIKYYILCKEDNEQLKDIFRSLQISKEKMVKLFLEANEQDRLISIGNQDDEILKYLDKEELVRNELYKVLILFDRAVLINIFNMPAPDKADNKNKDDPEGDKNSKEGEGRTVYDELCRKISEGEDVEALCGVITHVHSTFWDMEKLPKFHKALSIVLKDSKATVEGDEPSQPVDGKENEERENKDLKNNVRDSKDSWLVHIQNPLLFCIKLVHFFKKMKDQLDFKDKEINDLSKSLLDFCISYCQNANEDVLMINLFDKDNREREFLEYAFMVKEMSILDIEFIEGLIYQMWNLGRHTMQTITQFMRVNFMKDDIQKFSMSVFTRKYEMPIEDGDAFQMDYQFTSNSVFLKVCSEILWPITLIVMEFIFSLRIIAMYKEVVFTKNWLSEYFARNPVFSVLHLYLRGNYIISNILKSILLKIFKREGFYHSAFYSILNVLYVLQMIVDPLFFWDEFWVVNNLQMLIVNTMLGYVFYNGLSLNDIGVILRIFARMVYVVLIFGTVSCFIMVLIAYPIHTVYIDFDQRVDGQIFPQMNFFRSLYIGVLTLFEFVFGAVVFVRPYLEQNLYTYSISFIMVIFSFFGNIMLANMLVAFLAKQFESITRKAKYYTQRMQFGLVKIFDMDNLDTMFTMPYPFTCIALPFYLFMIKKGSVRTAVNLFLRKVIHIINIFIPTFIIMNVFLWILMVVRFLEILLFILIRAPVQPIYILYIFVWVIGGPFLLLKLYIQDIFTMFEIMLNFKNEGEDLIGFNLDDNTKNNVIRVLSKINKVASNYLQDKREESRLEMDGSRLPSEKVKVTLGEFLNLMGINDIKNAILRKTLAGDHDQKEADDVDDDAQDEEDDGDDEGGNSLAAKYKAIYSQEESKLAPLLLRKFAILPPKMEEAEKLEIDLEFMTGKMKGNLNIENIHKLIGFDKTTLYKARKFIYDTDKEMDVKAELGTVKNRIAALDKQIETILNELDEMKDLIKK
jgi:hypothetical protein